MNKNAFSETKGFRNAEHQPAPKSANYCLSVTLIGIIERRIAIRGESYLESPCIAFKTSTALQFSGFSKVTPQIAFCDPCCRMHRTFLDAQYLQECETYDSSDLLT